MTADSAELLLGCVALAILVAASGLAFLVCRSGRRLRGQIAARERALTATHANLETALASMANGLCLWTADNRLMLYNDRLLTLLRLPAERIKVGMSFREYLAIRAESGNFGDRPFDEVYAERVALIAVNQPVAHLDATVDGRIISILHRPTAEGGWIATYEDVTEQLHAERARAEAEARLLRERERLAEEASRAKSDFLAMMSHEIRTPMNAVLGLAGCLLDGQLPPEQHRMVEAIHDSGDLLLRILNDILDFTKLEAGRMTFEDAPFSPAALTQGVVSVLGPQAVAKGLRLDAECDPALPEGVLGDAGRVRQILLNLVSNATKFTDAGSVTVRAECLRRAEGRAALRWTVRDTGIGIQADRLPTLFGEFVQADASITRRFGGSGLGLAISKRLALRMGGDITVDSIPGEGATFRVDLTLPISERLPRTGAHVGDQTPAFRALLAARRERLRVLFAEDNATNQMVARQMLKGLDVQVDVVGDGREAVTAAARFAYDVIFMDMRMPELDGPRAARLIRQLGGRLAEVPIIALTANAFAEDIRACLDAGMNQFLPKPVSRDLLLAAMIQALTGEGRAGRDETGATAPAPSPDCDWTMLDGLRDDLGPDVLADMLRVFQADARARLAAIAAHRGDAARLRAEAHSLRGAAAAAGATALAALAGRVEAAARGGAHATDADLDALRTALGAFLRQVGAPAAALDHVSTTAEVAA